MGRRIAISIIMLLASFYCGAQMTDAMKGGNRLFLFGWDNDLFASTDYYYTQGIGMGIVNPFLETNPLNRLLLIPGKYNNVWYSLSLSQQMYTPKNLRSEDVQYFDRPYAGLLLLNSSVTTSNYEKKLILRSEMTLGVMGPMSGADFVQYHFHDVTDNPLPNGWNNQRSNWPVLNYNLQVNKGLGSNDYFDLAGVGVIRAGTLYDDVSMGINLRAGFLNPYYKQLGLPGIGRRKFEFFGSLTPMLKLVAYNATMQGGGNKNENEYFLRSDEIEHVIFQLKSSLGINYKNVGLQYYIIWQTREFIYGVPHEYHSTKFIWRF
ncbi:lipid A deacylase LpxR family protein [Marinilabiliaceae bacterium JC017]|nr:lipid A deacylase LpxR family protein [Marinilabiliaceae bacterium JC017]